MACLIAEQRIAPVGPYTGIRAVDAVNWAVEILHNYNLKLLVEEFGIEMVEAGRIELPSCKSP